MKDLRLNFIHLCDEATFSQEGKLSIIGIFDVVHITHIPGSLLKAYLICNFTVLNDALKETKMEVKVKNKQTNEEIMKIPELTVAIPGANPVIGNKQKTIGLSLQLVNMTFKKVGEYTIIVEANGEKLGESIFFVNLAKPKKEAN